MYIYADILFLVNFSMDYLCLYVTAKILHRAVSLKRLLISSATGGIYSVISLLITLNSGIALALDILVCLFMSAIVFHKRRQARKTLVSALLYFVVSMTLGGVMTALFNLLNKLNLPFDGIEQDSLSVWSFALLAIAAAVISVFGGGVIFRKNEVKSCTLSITFDGKAREFSALCDSGNLVRDAISGRPVIIIDENFCENFVDKQIIDDFLHGIPSDNPSYAGMRITPINTVSGGSSLVLLRAQSILITYQKRGKSEVFSPDALFALGSINKNDEYNAVVPYSLFRG